MEQIVDLERRIELALNEIERSVSLYSRNLPLNASLAPYSRRTNLWEPLVNSNVRFARSNTSPLIINLTNPSVRSIDLEC